RAASGSTTAREISVPTDGARTLHSEYACRATFTLLSPEYCSYQASKTSQSVASKRLTSTSATRAALIRPDMISATSGFTGTGSGDSRALADAAEDRSE